VAALLIVGFAGSTLLTPLYELYRESFGFSKLTLTLIYSVYVIGNLIALLLLGRLSDQIGRRRVGLPALVLAAASTLVFLFARHTGWLFWGRMLSGLANGLLSGTATAWIAELYGRGQRPRATAVAVAANATGLAIGALVGGVLAQYAPWPLRLPYLVYLAALVVVGAMVARSRETVADPAHHLHDVSLRPRLGVPRHLRARFAVPAVAGFGTLAVTGFYAALLPTILRSDLGYHNHALGGLVVAALFALGAVSIVAIRKLDARATMLGGLVLLLPSLGLVVLAQALHSLPILLVGAAIAGVCTAMGYFGNLAVVNELAPDEHRAEVTSSFFVMCFLGNSVPVIGMGLVGSVASSMTASVVFACVIAAFAIAALITARMVK
jgi:MFS family permease